MTISPRLEAAAASTRTESDVRRARAAKPLTMLAVIQKGAQEAVKADPRPLSTMDVIRASVATMGAFPDPQPLRDIRSGEYLDAPCSSPAERILAKHYTPTCACGYAMGAHPKVAK